MKSILSSLFFLVAVFPVFAQRLPQNVTPSHYKLSLDPSIEQKSFSGEETIDVNLAQPSKEIVLHSLDLDISSAEISASGSVQNAEVTYDKPDEMVRLTVPNAIPGGVAQMHLKFSGKLTEGLRGLYLSKTARREYAVTQFEGTYARMMFPCFDEPAFKATFDLTVNADSGDTAISNGRIVKDSRLGADRHQIVFSTSPKMSTYLVALAIGDWQCQEHTVDGVPIRVCAVPEKKGETGFALDVAAHSIQFYDQWYGIKYPFGKLDMLAIPDYEWGGMENTASIFYRDTALLLDEANASVFRKRGQSTVIAHEIAHQWFGDLVTAAWWDDIWLNEGFATWMERKPIEAWHPEWHLEDDAAAEAQQIIGVDSLASARAIHGNPSTPSEIKEMFDGITYEKGGAVLRMLESYLGPEVFRKGVNAYLRAHMNGNATSADFWQAEALASGKPVDKIMPTFVMQPGVPMLDLATSCSGNGASVSVSQQRFFLVPRTVPAATSTPSANGGQTGSEAAAGSGPDPGELWQIPVCFKSPSGGQDSCELVTRETQRESLAACPQWLFGNRDAKGYYRVAYAPNDLARIADLAETKLNPPERIALVEDTWAMTRAGKDQVSGFLKLTESLHGEQNRTVIGLISGHLDYIEASLVEPDQRQKYWQFIRSEFGPLAQQLGWQPRANDTEEQKALRASLLEILGSAGDPEAVRIANDLVEQYVKKPGSVDETLAGFAFPAAAENGGPDFYQRLVQDLENAKSQDEYYHCLFALADFRQPQFADRTLNLVTNGIVRQQDYPRFFGALLANPATREPGWQYLKSHWDDLAQKVTSFGGAGAVSALGNSCSAEMRDDVKQFFSDHAAPGAQRAVKQSIERMSACIDFKRQQQSDMSDWLAAQK